MEELSTDIFRLILAGILVIIGLYLLQASIMLFRAKPHEIRQAEEWRKKIEQRKKLVKFWNKK